jgi:tetratricopeptide (TPR) repeat protein
MTSALALIRNEPELAPLGFGAARVLAICDARIADRETRAAARERLAAFQRSYDEAVFYQSQYTGLEPEANVRASRDAARQTLEQFEPEGGSGQGLDLAPRAFDASEAAAITERYYELALILAEATAQPMAGEDPVAQARKALGILERAGRVRPPTKVFFAHRAEYLSRTGDRAGAEAMRSAAGSAAQAENSAVDDFLEGEAAYRRRNYGQAIAALRRVLAHQPGHFWGQYLLALCQLKQHQPAAAQAALTICQAERPGFVWTYLLKGFAEGEMGEFDLAEAEFQRAAERGLDDATRYVMLVNRGVIRVRRGRTRDAVEDFRAAIALKSDRFQAYVNLAQAYENLGRLDQAREALDRAIDRFPNEAVLYRARARVHRLGSRDPEALADLGRAIALSPADDSAPAGDHLERALIFDQAGRHEEALAECDRARAIQPDRPDIDRVRGAVLVKLRRFDEAIRSFDICLAKGKPSASLYEARGLALAQRGAYERAIADYTLALGAGRVTASIYTNRGWAYLFSGAPAPASHDFDQALRLDPADARALSGRALAHVQQRKVREAIADARASVRGPDPDARLIYNAARVYCQAAACIEADPDRRHADWDLAGQYRVESLSLIGRSLSLMPAAERAAFWTQVVQSDGALEPIRASRKFLDLDAQLARATGRVTSVGASPR